MNWLLYFFAVMQIITIIGIITTLRYIENNFDIQAVLNIVVVTEFLCIYITCIVFTLVSLILGCKQNKFKCYFITQFMSILLLPAIIFVLLYFLSFYTLEILSYILQSLIISYFDILLVFIWISIYSILRVIMILNPNF